ncbi:AAA domain-containing protein [Pseudonocardia hispaniensis]|uniref:AAA domain-containing protein n=1 Tax=Pseudonocardia hispaniensis TaxID=904933 RepID=A0ABW1IYR1_9PSEU
MTPEWDPLLRDQVIRLMGVLRQLAVTRNSPIRHTSGYDKLMWLDDVQEHCTVQMPTGPGDELLRVPRVQLEPEPPAPRELAHWIHRPADTDGAREPVLAQHGPLPGIGQVDLGDAPEIRAAFDEWMAAWRPWAERERQRRPRRRMFEMLFDLHRMATDRPESTELVLSAGLLHLPAPAGEQGVHVHLITQPVRIEQNLETGEMVCMLADDTGLRLEDDELLSGRPDYDPSGSAVLRDRLHELATSPIDPAIAAFLKEWAERALRIASTVDGTWDEPSGDAASLTAAPAIVARRRGAFALREYYDRISRSLADSSQPIPLGLGQLVRPIEPADRVAWLERAGGVAPADLAEQPLFPRPANEEQAQIIRRLGSDTGVVVEGPPGTGKTHTIANLVSALLARGQRVLVTSEKAQALRVLRDKLPSGIQELCVSITDASPKGKSDLQKSVATLAGRKSDFNPERTDRLIADLTTRRDDVQRRRALLLEDIRALREAETYQHPEIAPGFRGTLSGIVRAMNATADQDGWVGQGVRGELPLTTAQMDELLRLLRERGDRRASRRHQQLPEPGQLLAADRFAELAEAIARGDEARSGAEGGLVGALQDLPPDALGELAPLCAEVSEATAALRQLPTQASWALSMADTLLAGGTEHLWQRAVEQLSAVDAALDHDRAAGFAPMTVATSIDVSDAARVFERLATYLENGGSLRRMFKSAEQKNAERFADSVRVEGEVPATVSAAGAAAHHLRVLAIARVLDSAFQPLRMGMPPDADRPVLVNAMVELRRSCAAVDRVLRAAAALRRLFAGLPPADRPTVVAVLDLERVATVAIAVTQARAAALARAELDAAANALLSAVPPPARSPELTDLVDAHRVGDPARYEQALVALDRARREQSDQQRCDELLSRLRTASSTLAEDLEVNPGDSVWTQRLARWPQAWAHGCAATWVGEQTTPGREQRLEGELDGAVKDLLKLTGELAAAMAWRACLSRMTAEQVQALQSYRNEMVKIGKGTGKFAERSRQAAREAMAVAQSAVPAWVMPIRQVLDSVPPQAGAFDVVIVDEASQVELTSAFLLWLAPRVIVVGDDKQCTPSEVASGALQPIFDRLDAELHDIPTYLRSAFTPKDSLFSLLRSRFGQLIRLREHFRCMPEIITWSSHMFYRDAPLIPLRQFGADRLPPLRTTYVAGAVTESTRGSVVNRAEAAAIAASVRECLDDPAYEGKTFGVVVLQGRPQIDIVGDELKKLVSPEEWRDRRLRIGAPPDFQGDERHVVWLSLVVAPNSPRTALTKLNFEQSFNVAASRAQDQLWLFHSVTADLLRPADLRRSLLDYMTSAGSSGLEPVRSDVDPDRRHDAFDSLFEQRVFLDLVARGYHVTPQFETNGRRIDLVVTGTAGKLAVECDGEAFHTTPEQREADLHREQELKRCGWTFVRIRESIYYLNREEALAPVWAALDRLGIGPFGERANGAWIPRSPSTDGPGTSTLEDRLPAGPPRGR